MVLAVALKLIAVVVWPPNVNATVPEVGAVVPKVIDCAQLPKPVTSCETVMAVAVRDSDELAVIAGSGALASAPPKVIVKKPLAPVTVTGDGELGTPIVV